MMAAWTTRTSGQRTSEGFGKRGGGCIIQHFMIGDRGMLAA